MAPKQATSAREYQKYRVKVRNLLKTRASNLRPLWSENRDDRRLNDQFESTTRSLVRLVKRCKDEDDRRFCATEVKYEELAYRLLSTDNPETGKPHTRRSAQDVVSETYHPEGEDDLGEDAPTGGAVLKEVYEMLVHATVPSSL
jgi:hypothetical protein